MILLKINNNKPLTLGKSSNKGPITRITINTSTTEKIEVSYNNKVCITIRHENEN